MKLQSLVERSYYQFRHEFPSISPADVTVFLVRIQEIDEDDYEGPFYDPLIEPLIECAMAQFLFSKKNENEKEVKLPHHQNDSFNPNSIRIHSLEALCKAKAEVALQAFTFYEFSPRSASLDVEMMMGKVRNLISNKVLISLIRVLVKKLYLTKANVMAFIGFSQRQRKTTATRGMILLYYILLDLYLEDIDGPIRDGINNGALNCFWWRSLNAAILAFSDKRKISNAESLQLHVLIPALLWLSHL